MIREAKIDDLDTLVDLERRSFFGDEISRRSFRYLLTKAHATTLVDDEGGWIRGYVMLLFSNVTALARLYSIAVDPGARGKGVGRALVEAAERSAIEHDCVTMRLEIREDNQASIALFKACGFRQFGAVADYYEDHAAALRFEKNLAPQLKPNLARVPFYPQTLPFTCGPAALMMAMKAIDPGIELDRGLELRIWREATSIFMSRGHGGCGPYGLALSAYHRGFGAEIFVKERGVFLVDSVRSAEKKEVMRIVHQEFLEEIKRLHIKVHYRSMHADELEAAFEAGGIPVVLISSYRIDRKRIPHWLVVSGFDERFAYVNDPYVDVARHEAGADCIDIPIPRREFERLARYGRAGQKAVIVVSPRDAARAE
jgi:ribosomal protein S18 acetylase RimI-like enzyme